LATIKEVDLKQSRLMGGRGDVKARHGAERGECSSKDLMEPGSIFFTYLTERESRELRKKTKRRKRCI